MKRVWAFVLAFALLIGGGAGTIFSQAAELSGTCGENLTWTLRDGTLTISGTGKMDTYAAYGRVYHVDRVPPRAPWAESGKQVRSIVAEEGVTTIGDGAFGSCVNARTVTLPQSLACIGVSAFAFCTELDDVYIPSDDTEICRYAFVGSGGVRVRESNPAYSTDENGLLFTKDRDRLLHYPVHAPAESFTIPESVRTIEEYAFARCTHLKHLTVPGTLESTAFAFMYCDSLESVTICEGIRSIEIDAFFDCKNLRYAELPDGLESIEINAFYYTDLQYLHIPASVTDIEPYAFPETTNTTRKTVFPYMQPFWLCADSADCAAKAYADEHRMRFYVCGGTHDVQHGSLLQRLLYVFSDQTRAVKLLSALIAYVGNRIKQIGS